MLAQTFRDFELIIADDGSPDDTKQVVENFAQTAWFPVRYFRQENKGRSAARNLGLKNSQAEFIVFIDDHIVLDNEFLIEHIKVHEQQATSNAKSLAAVRGRSVLIEEPIEVVPVSELAPLVIDKQRIQDPFYTFITNNISVRRRVIEEVGGFDEDFKNYGFQDSELGYRIKRKGYLFAWAPKAVGQIFACGISYEQSRERARQVGLSARIFARKHPEGKWKVGINPANHLFYCLTSLDESRFVRSWIARQEAAVKQGNISLAERLQYWIKHYYFCQGMFLN
jgi:glycosyltransferase involved in cell wall biosynthesis